MNYINFKNINILVGKKLWLYLFLMLFMMIVLGALETLSIAAIPLILAFILNPDSFYDKYNSLFESTYFRIFFEDFSSENLVFLVFIIFFLKNFYIGFFFYIKGLIVRNFISKTTVGIFKDYLNLQLVNFQSYNSSFITNLISTQTGLSFNFLDASVVVSKEIIIVLFLSFFAFTIEPIFLVIVIGFLSFFSILYYIIIKKFLSNIGNATIKYKSLFYKYLQDSLNLFKDIKITKNQTFLNKFSDANLQLHKTSHIRGFLISLPKPILETVAILALLIFTLILQKNNQNSEEIISTLTLLVLISIRFLPALNIITSSVSIMKSTFPSFKLLLEEKNKLKKLQSFRESNIFFNLSEKNKNIIKLEKVNFSFNDNQINLKDVNIEVEKKFIYCGYW